MSKRWTVRYLRPAQRDLEEIVDYISRDDPEAAVAFVDEIDTSLSRLAQFPASGSPPRDERLRRRGYRVVPIRDYLAFYTLRGRTVQIRRIIHGRRRYGFLL
jgi:toxin ParE1/3/4